MGLRSSALLRLGVSVSMAMVAALADPTEVRAEVDGFGLGDGHTGAKAAGALDEVINTYAALLADAPAGASSLSIGAAMGAAVPFVTGDLVLVWRATGLPATDAPSGAPNDVSLTTLAAGSVGRFELARIASVSASTITLTKPLVRAFVKDVSQVVRVPEYTTVTVAAGASLVAAPWATSGAGFAGGILVFMARDGLTNNGRLHADARGFRGGLDRDRVNPLAVTCTANDGTLESGFAPKGEGVVSSTFGGDLNGGRGNRANGAGGGNCVESGGGGGGNGGKGGLGGESFVGGAQGQDRGGLGGTKLLYELASPANVEPHITMGGGGGAGEQKDNAGSGGGQGGGVVFVRARSIVGVGIIGANGQTAENATLVGIASDGAGGGGAGGTIVLRVVEALACNGIEARGGNGGETLLAGASLFGPGGGGAGGRVLVQTTAKSVACSIDVAGGANGVAGDGSARLATPGGLGLTQTDPNYCFSKSGTPLECANPRPVCDTATGYCAVCDGGFGLGSAFACVVATAPVCVGGACEGCNGDFNTGATQECPSSASPYCSTGGDAGAAGSCGKCTTDASCAGPGHGGPICNVLAGACGTVCTEDKDCKATEWCAPQAGPGASVCIPKTPNRQAVPSIPPIGGECTKEKGQRVCLSAVCEEDDDLCGTKNGNPCTDASALADGGTGPSAQCRSGVCFRQDLLCGLPNGEPCVGASLCRSDLCKDGVCTGCNEDSDCKLGLVCDAANKSCLPGCRPGQAPPDGGTVHGGCDAGLRCIALDGAPIGQCQPDVAIADGGVVDDTSGLIEGAGCSCNSTLSSAASPLAILGVVWGAALIARRRRSGSASRRQTRDNDA